MSEEGAESSVLVVVVCRDVEVFRLPRFASSRVTLLVGRGI